ncbi:hypothetical protein HPB51_010878 [Rhipicephalus microplus]|uniref:Tick transposon n=1 Tax=Rhipicephalus microplus TaxID=6941 RepID=A0A9J6DM97_RHIMP|nr:hypothetical protein HPB51_010878 [Rhipicephalus microplus]
MTTVTWMSRGGDPSRHGTSHGLWLSRRPHCENSAPLRPYRLVHAPAAAAGTVLGSVAAGQPHFPPMFPFDRSPAVQRPDAVIRDAIRAPMMPRHVRGMRYLYGPFEHHSPKTTLTLSTTERVRRRRQETKLQKTPLTYRVPSCAEKRTKWEAAIRSSSLADQLWAVHQAREAAEELGISVPTFSHSLSRFQPSQVCFALGAVHQAASIPLSPPLFVLGPVVTKVVAVLERATVNCGGGRGDRRCFRDTAAERYKAALQRSTPDVQTNLFRATKHKACVCCRIEPD